MKNVIILFLSLFLSTGCSTFSYHKVENITDEGVRVGFGNKDKVHIGDKVDVFENKCTESGRGGSRCKIKLVGTLTLVKVEEETSLAKPDAVVVLKDGQVFKLAKHCEENPKDCE